MTEYHAARRFVCAFASVTAAWLICISLIVTPPARAQTADDAAAWSGAVRQVFIAKCIECHTPDSPKRSAARAWADAKDLAVLRANFVLRKGEAPSDPTSTDLWQLLTDEPDFRMPPPDAVAGALTDAELLVVRRWLEMGAPLGEVALAATGEGSEPEHTHADGDEQRDAAGTPGTLSTPRRLMRWLGKLHPPATHLPIGLLLAAALAEGLVMLTGSAQITAARRFCTAIAALAAVGAAMLGWFNGEFHTASNTLTLHRWLGVTVACLSLLVVILGELARRSDRRTTRLCFRLLLFATAALIGFTGHLGGTLVFGPDYYAW